MTLTSDPLSIAAEVAYRRERLAGSGLQPARRQRRLRWPSRRQFRPGRLTGTVRAA